MISRLARLVLPFIDHAATAPFATVVDHPPQVDREVFTRLWEQARSVAPGEVADYERETGYAIDRQWMDDLALRTQIVIKKSELSYLHGRVLYSTLSAYAAQSNATSINVIETGTARGFSSLCMARALADQGKAGKIISFDVVPNEVPTYWNCIADFEGKQTRAQLLKGYSDLVERYIVFHSGDTKLELPKVSIPRVHFAFFDAVHTYEYVMFEFEAIRHKQLAGDIIVFDDYNKVAFPGVVQAVDEIAAKHGYTKRVITPPSNRSYVVARKS